MVEKKNKYATPKTHGKYATMDDIHEWNKMHPIRKEFLIRFAKALSEYGTTRFYNSVFDGCRETNGGRSHDNH